MPCYHPITAWKSKELDDVNPATGKVKMVFRADAGLASTKTELKCGQCIGCRLDRAREWAVRCIHENSRHEKSCWLTLTYNDEHLPIDGSLRPRDMVLFLKRLRKKFAPETVRFFQCGEYGDINKRPHHHVIIFGIDFPDKKPISRRKKNLTYSSEILQELWPFGFSCIGELTFDSACYTARYILKKQTGKFAKEHYGERLPEYITMSRKPGIGKDFYESFKEDLYNYDKCVVHNKFICRPPRYYDKLYESSHSEHFAQLKRARKLRALANPHNTDERRATKKRIAEINQAKLQREI